MKYVFTSSDPRGGCRGFPHTKVNLSNCQRCKKCMIWDKFYHEVKEKEKSKNEITVEITDVITWIGSCTTGLSSVTFSKPLDDVWWESREDWFCILISATLKPLLWFSRNNCEVVSRANLVTRENFSRIWIGRSRAGSWALCLCFPPYREIFDLSSWESSPALLSKFDGDTSKEADETALAIEPDLGSSKEDKVLYIWK